MSTQDGSSAEAGQEPIPRRKFLGWPATRLGWVAAGLTVAFHLLMAVNSFVFMRIQLEFPGSQVILPLYGIGMMLCGLAAGILGLVAILRLRERSWLVWLAILPMTFVLFLVIGEFLMPH